MDSAGSDPACFSRFLEDEPGAEVISLHKNYRSSGTITEGAAAVISNNPGAKAQSWFPWLDQEAGCEL